MCVSSATLTTLSAWQSSPPIKICEIKINPDTRKKTICTRYIVGFNKRILTPKEEKAMDFAKSWMGFGQLFLYLLPQEIIGYFLWRPIARILFSLLGNPKGSGSS